MQYTCQFLATQYGCSNATKYIINTLNKNNINIKIINMRIVEHSILKEEWKISFANNIEKKYKKTYFGY